MSATLVKFPERDIADLPRALRALADEVESGRYDDAHNLVWAIDCGNGRVELGLLGSASEPGAEAHLLFGIAMRKLENL